MKKLNKTFLNILITILTIAAVNYYIFSTTDILSFLTQLEKMDFRWLFMALASITFFIITDIFITFFMVKIFYKKPSFRLAFKSVLGLYVFNNITPFATGGFPYKIYLFTRSGISFSKTSTITISNNLIYQGGLILFSLPALFFLPAHNTGLIIILIVINIIIQSATMGIQLLAMYKPDGLRKIAFIILKILKKIKIIKSIRRFYKKIERYISDFYKFNEQIKRNRKYVFRLVLLQVISFAFLFSTVYFIFRGFNINYNYFSIVFMTSCMYLFAFIIPTPGASGGIEGTFYLLFKHLGERNEIITIMLVWRFLTYYLLIILGSLSFIVNLKNKKSL